MPLELSRKRFTVEEFHRMGEAGVIRPEDRVELIRGEILMMSPIGSRHVYYVNLLNDVLVRAVGELGQVSIQNPVEIPEDSEPQPDVVVVRRRGRHYLNTLPQNADVLLAIEVAETSLEYDRKIKVPLYAESGIPEVWILDVKRAVIERYTGPGPSGYAVRAELTASDAVALIAIPSCRIELGPILG